MSNNKKRLIIIIGGALILGFIAIGINDLVKTKREIELKNLQIENRETKVQELHVQQEKTNLELDKALKEKSSDQAELDRIKQEKDELDKQNRELEAQLQAKAEAKAKLAKASTTVINAATATQTASASSGGNVEAIIRSAAIKHGLDPDWFYQLAGCESTWNPNAVNYGYNENGYPSGLYQHLSGYWPARAAAHGYAGASVFDAEANANVTAAMWKSGSHLWECR